MRQREAARFVLVWTAAATVQEAAAKLSRPLTYVNRVAEYLRSEGVILKPLPVGAGPLPKCRTPLTAAQQKLVEDHFFLVAESAKHTTNSVIAATLGAEGVQGVATDTLIESAREYDPTRFPAVPFPAYARFNIRRAVYKAANHKHPVTGPHPVGEAGLERDPRTGRSAPVPDHEAIRSEEMDLVARALGGPLDLGSSQHRRKFGEVNFDDLCRLGERLGVPTKGLGKEKLLTLVAAAIRARVDQERPDIDVSEDQFVNIWQRSASVPMVAAALGWSPDDVAGVADWLREEGVNLKAMPAATGRPSNWQAQPSEN